MKWDLLQRLNSFKLVCPCHESCPSSVLVYMIYCEVKYCCSNSSIPGVILHSIREEWLNLVDWKRPNPNVICNEHFPS